MKLIRQDQRFFINFFHLGVILCFFPIFMSSTHTDKKNICFFDGHVSTASAWWVSCGFVRCEVLSFVFFVSRTQFMPRRRWCTVGTRSSGDHARLQSNGLSHPRAKAGGKRRQLQFLEHHRRSLEGPAAVEGWSPRSSLARFGAGAVECQSISGGGVEDSEGGGSQACSSTTKTGRSVRTRGETRSCIESLGRGRP